MVLTSYEALASDTVALTSIRWEVVLLDERHLTKGSLSINKAHQVASQLTALTHSPPAVLLHPVLQLPNPAVHTSAELYKTPSLAVCIE